jgi:hypothetical protein
MGTGTFSANSEPAVLDSPIKNLFSGLNPWTTGTSSTTSSGIGYYGKNGVCYAPSSITNNDPLLSYNGVKSNTSSSSNYNNPYLDTYLNQEQQKIDLASSWSDAQKGLGIYDATMKGVTGLANIGMGIWQGIENSRNLKKQREVWDKQIALAQEQIDASKEYRQQRADEIARLNRVRNNTQKSFNTGTTITRSY